MIHLLGAGASKGLVTDLQTGPIEAYFAAAGEIRDRVVAGDRCDVVILTAALLGELGAQGLLEGAPIPIGRVRTGVAVPAGRPIPGTDSPESLRAALLAARGVYIPDPHVSTAGIHFMRVLRALDIEQAVLPHLRPFPNGATAMHHLARASEENPIGCTQITEIKYTPGLSLAGPLPDALGLATVYSAAVRAGTEQSIAAQALVALLTGPASQEKRLSGGFEPAG